MSGSDSLVQNITKLEINTIIKDSMTARKMPDPGNALLDIAHTYTWKLSDLGIPIFRWFGHKDACLPAEYSVTADGHRDAGYLPALTTLEDELSAVSGDPARIAALDTGDQGDSLAAPPVRIDVPTFQCIRWAAATALHSGEFNGATSTLLTRICKNSDQLKNLLWRLHGNAKFADICGKSRAELNNLEQQQPAYDDRSLLKLTPQDATMLRKIWEIGVEEIVAQTTIDLDGDTINRISRAYTSPGQQHVIEMHRLGINTAVGYWQGIMQALATFVGKVIGTAMSGSGRN